MADGFLRAITRRMAAWMGGEPSAPLSLVPPEHEVTPGEYGGLKEREEKLSSQLGVPAPRLVVVDKEEPNGSYNPADDTVRMTTGSLQRFSEREQNSELAHEVGHAKDRRERPGSVPQRDREFRADALAVTATGDPDARISGLRKIEDARHHDHAVMQSEINDDVGHGAATLCGNLPEFAKTIVQESSFHWRQLLRRLHIDKHPLAEERYQRLEAMKNQTETVSQNER